MPSLIPALCRAGAFLALATIGCDDSSGPEMGGPDGTGESEGLRVLTGALPLYHLQTKLRNDVSGAVFLPGEGRLLLVDDGGEDAMPDTVPLYFTDTTALFKDLPG